MPALTPTPRALALTLALLLLAAATPARAAAPTALQFFSLPGAARPLSLAASDDAALLFVGTARRNRFAEIHALETGADGRLVGLAWSVEIDGHANALAIEGSRLYVASSRNDAELVIVDTDLRQVVGRFDAAGTADARSIEVVAPGVVLLTRRRGPGPEIHRLDVSDPANVIVLEALEDPRVVRPTKPDRLARYYHRGQLRSRLDRETPRGSLHYLGVSDRHAEVHVVERRVPVVFDDVNGDGIYRLGCVADSNTVSYPTRLGWCERLRARIADPDFQIVNVSAAGATVTPNQLFEFDGTSLMQQALAHEPDAVVLAFGTNDVFQGRTGAQIHDAYVALRDTASAAGIAFYAATTPPIGTCPCPAIGLGNTLLRDTFADDVLEFHTGFTPEHFIEDGYHLSELGRELRAARAFALLANPFVYGLP